MSTSEPIHEPESLPGREILDQLGRKLGQITALYAPDDEGPPMWVTVEVRTGMLGGRNVFVPLGRIKEEDGVLQIPYSAEHLLDAPPVADEERLSEDEEHTLRDYFGIDRGDEPDVHSYSTQGPHTDTPSHRIEAPPAED